MARRNFSKVWGYNMAMQEWSSIYGNNITYLHYYNLLKLIAINIYKWSNLPTSIDPRFLELKLFEDGKVVYFNDEVMGNLCLQSIMQGELNVYQNPVYVTAYAVNGYNRASLRVGEDCVLIYDNYLHTIKHPSIDMFARKLYNISRTIDVNLNAQKTPYIIKAEESQKLTLKNMYKQVQENEPVIYTYKKTAALTDKGLDVLETTAPYLADKLRIELSNTWNEAMMYLGVNSASLFKRERTNEAESTGNYEQVSVTREAGLSARQMAVEEINRIFGTAIEVSPNKRLQEIYKATVISSLLDKQDPESDMEGGDGNE